MKIMVEVEIAVNIEGDRSNIHEILEAVDRAEQEFKEQLCRGIVEQYQEGIVDVLCRGSGREAKRGLGGHERKDEPGRRCRSRTFQRAGSWSKERRLEGKDCQVVFRPLLVACQGCGKKFTPVLAALELEPYQRGTVPLLRKVMESVADTSYRRGSHQLAVLGEVPVPKSTMHRWAASLEWPLRKARGDPFLLSDGTGFKKQPGQRGEVRIVLELRENGSLWPLGVWAGTTWKEIGRQVTQRLRGQPQLFIGDGERAMEQWIGRLAKKRQRSQWHFVRDSRVLLWHDQVKGKQAKGIMQQLSQLMAIEIPASDFEEVSAADKADLAGRVAGSEQTLRELEQEFQHKGYDKAALYLSNARENLFTHLRMWLETGIIAPRTASIVENVIRELARRLKKVGWNWSDAGATRMGRMIMLRRYDSEGWNTFWRSRMNLKDRCQISITKFQAKLVA